jgi:ABC-2 type transport system ATP-binding protein
VIEAAGLRKTFRPSASVSLLLRGKLRGDEILALDGVDLKVARGEAVALMGENGAGKSTLLRILAGLLMPSAGRATVCGVDVAEAQAARRLSRKVGYVPADERGLTPHLSPREHLAFFAALHGHPRDKALSRAAQLISRMGLHDVADRPLRDLSTGMRRRTALARGLLASPDLLLLDEPSRGVDPAGTAKLHAFLKEELTRDCAMVIATHDVAEAEALCTRVAIMKGARITHVVSPTVAHDHLGVA